jgi:hypothetical protein
MHLKLNMPNPTNPWPKTAAYALAQGLAYYMPPLADRVCPKDSMYCRHRGDVARFGNSCCELTLYFTITQQPICVCWDLAHDEYMNAQRRGDPITANDAMDQGKDFYYISEPGKYCGHVGKRTINGKCHLCATAKANKPVSPRQAALDAGEAWYMPAEGDLCRKGHRALRRVANGECSQCTAERNVTTQATTIRQKTVQELYPDMIIDYDAAKATGFKVYRTGKPCSHGHTGWRYVSTRNCITCMGR